MNRTRLVLPLGVILAVLGGTGSATSARAAQDAAQKKPLIQIIEVQYLESTSANADEKPTGQVRMRVRNNNSDRTVTGIDFRVIALDPGTRKVLEEMPAYIHIDAVGSNSTMKITPGKTDEVVFYISRSVKGTETPAISVKIANFVYKKYDPQADAQRPIELFATSKWPYPGRTDPVNEETPDGK